MKCVTVDFWTFFLTDIYQSAQRANDWATEIFLQCNIDYDAAFRQNAETCVLSSFSDDLLNFQISCKGRLANLGYETQDIRYVEYAISSELRVQRVYKLTPRGDFDFY